MLIVLAGTIGAGKSSLAAALGQHLGTDVFYEAVDNNPVLDLYYQDPKKYAFLLQIFFLNKRFQSIKEAYKANNNVLDRSIFEDELFLTLNFKNGNVTKTELDIYKELLANMLEELEGMPKKRPDLLVYIDVSFDKMLERIDKRGRSFEQVDSNPDYTTTTNKSTLNIQNGMKITTFHLKFGSMVTNLISSKIQRIFNTSLTLLIPNCKNLIYYN